MNARLSSLDLVDAVSAGEPRAIARMLSRAESGAVEARAALDLIYQRTGRAHVVGITGVPGSGKSTLVAKLAAQFRKSARKVGIIAKGAWRRFSASLPTDIFPRKPRRGACSRRLAWRSPNESEAK